MAILTWLMHMFAVLVGVPHFTAAKESLTSESDSTLIHDKSERLSSASKAHRGAEERAKLLASLVRPQYDFQFDNTHPRYNLLWAMYGFCRHGERYVADTTQWKEKYQRNEKRHRDIIDRATDYAKIYDTVIDKHMSNGQLTKEIAKFGQYYYQISDDELEQFMKEHEQRRQLDDQERVVEAIQHIYRDWSQQGEHERAAVVESVIKTIEDVFPNRADPEQGPVKILLPGSGLNRLAHDIAALEGVEVTANELSPYMRMAYRFIESLSAPESRSIHPWVDWWSYQPSRQTLIQKVKFPDAVITKSEVLLLEGDFEKLFVNHTSHYDIVFTFFFMDTATNMMYYLDTISDILKPGGIWINIGPLLYHSATVEFSLDDLLAVTEEYGFKFLDVDENWGTLTLKHRKARQKFLYYLANEDGLRINAYKAQFFAAQLERKIGSGSDESHGGHDEL